MTCLDYLLLLLHFRLERVQKTHKPYAAKHTIPSLTHYFQMNSNNVNTTMCIKTNERSLSFYMKITTLCTYLGSTQSYSCVCSHVHEPQRDAGCLQMFSALFSEAGSVSEHKACQFSWTAWSESPRDPGLQTHCCTWLLLLFPF